MAILVARTNLPVWDFQKLASLYLSLCCEPVDMQLIHTRDDKILRCRRQEMAVNRMFNGCGWMYLLVDGVHGDDEWPATVLMHTCKSR